jgi:hypothetical protein
MGGPGSGRPKDYGRDTADACRALDVNALHRSGMLEAGKYGTCQWSRDGEDVASIGMYAKTDRLVLSYRWRPFGGEWEAVSESILIVRQPCRYGGTRPYFICPGVVNGRHCGRRIAKLFCPGRYFLCRHCHRLTYASQSEDASYRALRRTNKIRQQLGGEAGLAWPFPPKPRGMWWRTYERLRRKARHAEMQAEWAMALHLESLSANVKRRSRELAS